MSRFFVGQMVRKARGENVGLTGSVAEIDPFDERGLGVRMDSTAAGWDADGKPVDIQAGDICFGYPDEFEPILPEGHRACDDEFKRDLEKLLEGVPA